MAEKKEEAGKSRPTTRRPQGQSGTLTAKRGTGIDTLDNSQFCNIKLFSFTNNNEFEFIAFVTDFQDSFKTSWNTQEIYGKMDPISTYKNTTRKITLSFDIPSYNIDDARYNLDKVDELIQGLYPIYTSGEGGVSNLASPPLFRLKWANMIYNATKDLTAQAETSGLLGYLEGFDFKPKVDQGFFVNAVTGGTRKNIYPKLLQASFNFNVLHEHPLGKIINGTQHVSRISKSATANTTYDESFPHNFDS